MTEPSLFDAPPKPKFKLEPVSLWILEILRTGGWWTDYELQAHINVHRGRWYAIGTIGARRRDLKAALKSIGQTIADRRRAHHRNLWEYQLQRQGGRGDEA